MIEENGFAPFKFWFDGHVQDGMYYQNELFYRLQTDPIEQRAQLYHLACKMARREHLVVTTTHETCSIWISLRSPNISNLRPQVQNEPTHIGHLLE